MLTINRYESSQPIICSLEERLNAVNNHFFMDEVERTILLLRTRIYTTCYQNKKTFLLEIQKKKAIPTNGEWMLL